LRKPFHHANNLIFPPTNWDTKRLPSHKTTHVLPFRPDVQQTASPEISKKENIKNDERQ
jgi:hypothetical protein